MKHLDLFSGYGGFTIPAQKYGIETIGFSEIDKYACSVLNYHYPNIKNYGDITKIKTEDLPTVDIITGGSPCQDLSVAGKGAGLNGERSGLFFYFIRLIKEKQPTYFVWENVKGALSSQGGWDFARVQIEMEQAGYDVWWQVLNAKDFGVPQNRERIFAIGIRKGSGREILFEQISSGQNTKTNRKIKSARKFGSSGSYHSPNEIVSTPTQSMGTGGNNVPMTMGAKTGLYCVGIIPESIKEKGNYLPRERIFDAKGNARAVSTVGSQHPMYAVTARKHRTEFDTSDTVSTLTSHFRGSPDGDGRSGVIVHNLQPRSPNRPSLLKNKNAGCSGHLQRDDGTTYTLDTGNTQGIEQGTRIRRLIPIETERLMGLEDNWTAKGIVDGKEVDISDTQRYKMCGNGVVVNCVDYIYNLITKTL